LLRHVTDDFGVSPKLAGFGLEGCVSNVGVELRLVVAHFASNPGLLEQPVRESRLTVGFGVETGHRHPESGLCVVIENILCTLVPRLDIAVIVDNEEGVLLAAINAGEITEQTADGWLSTWIDEIGYYVPYRNIAAYR
jgi:hypothetical protein